MLNPKPLLKQEQGSRWCAGFQDAAVRDRNLLPRSLAMEMKTLREYISVHKYVHIHIYMYIHI